MNRIAFACMIVFVLVGALPWSARADTVLNPTSDAYTNNKFTGKNYDASGLTVGYESQVSLCTVSQRTYLRFSLSALEKNVAEQTTLRVYMATPPAEGGSLGLYSTTDDWNGSATSGSGDETSLTWSNAPDPITQLDTQPSGTSRAWIQFSGLNLANYLNSQRSANGGDEVASFVVQWLDCTAPVSGQAAFEDRENALGSGNTPIIYPATPTAITLNSFIAANPITPYLPYMAGMAVLVVVGLAAARKRAQKTNSQ